MERPARRAALHQSIVNSVSDTGKVPVTLSV
jgi:hypothetical protein